MRFVRTRAEPFTWFELVVTIIALAEAVYIAVPLYRDAKLQAQSIENFSAICSQLPHPPGGRSALKLPNGRIVVCPK